MAHDALEAHKRDELGISESLQARPLQAALASATSSAAGAILPLLVVLTVPDDKLVVSVAGTSLVSLAVLGALAAHAGGAGRLRGAVRVTFWSALAMALTMAVGTAFGTSV